MKKLIVHLACLCIALPLYSQEQWLAHKAILQKMTMASNPRIFLLSYPRSGNTLARYCLEVLTGRPTAQPYNTSVSINMPIGLLLDHPLDFSKAPIWKAHHRKHLNFAGIACNPTKDMLIVIIRNPKEALIRNLGKFNADALAKGTPLNNLRIYLDILQLFDEWDDDHKLLIYYEDMIQNPKEVMRQALIFLHEPLDALEAFMHEYQHHKKVTLKLYDYNGGAQSEGKTLFHSYKLSADEREKIDELIKNISPYLWEKYLEKKYSEKILSVMLCEQLRG